MSRAPRQAFPRGRPYFVNRGGDSRGDLNQTVRVASAEVGVQLWSAVVYLILLAGEVAERLKAAVC